jgi:hypothetical protein
MEDAGLIAVSIVNEGADLAITLNELSEGNVSAAIGLIPLVPAGAGRAIFRNASGELVAEFTGNAFAQLRTLFDKDSTQVLARLIERKVATSTTELDRLIDLAQSIFQGHSQAQKAYLLLRGQGAPDALARRFAALPIQSADEVKAILEKAGKYSGDTSKHFEIHNHHFYPEWLGGKPDGPTIRVRGYEHLTLLHPELLAFMKREFGKHGLTDDSPEQVRRLIAANKVTRLEINLALFRFYRQRYSQLLLSDSDIFKLISLGY